MLHRPPHLAGAPAAAQRSVLAAVDRALPSQGISRLHRASLLAGSLTGALLLKDPCESFEKVKPGNGLSTAAPNG